MKNEEGGIRSGGTEAKFDDKLGEPSEPGTRSLSKPIKGLVEQTHGIRAVCIDEIRRLLIEHMFTQMAMEKGIGDIKLLCPPATRRQMVSTVWIMEGLTIGENVSLKSTPALWVNPRTTHQALYRSRVPSGFSLCLKIHLLVTILAPGGRSTRRQVRLRWRASNSAAMAAHQCGS